MEGSVVISAQIDKNGYEVLEIIHEFIACHWQKWWMWQLNNVVVAAFSIKYLYNKSYNGWLVPSQ